MTPEESAQGRHRSVHEHFVPVVARVFAEHPLLKIAVFMVGQYWDDEAHDAVHYRLFFSQFEPPQMDAYNDLEADHNPNHPPGFDPDPYDPFYKEIPWDNNYDAIPLFAAFCKEGAHQEMDETEAFTPYAFFRRGPLGVEVEIVGPMLRPWLDGVDPLWASR